MHTIIFALLAVGAGACIAHYKPPRMANSVTNIDEPLWAAFSILGTVLTATIAMMILRPPAPSGLVLRSTAWWNWIGGAARRAHRARRAGPGAESSARPPSSRSSWARQLLCFAPAGSLRTIGSSGPAHHNGPRLRRGPRGGWGGVHRVSCDRLSRLLRPVFGQVDFLLLLAGGLDLSALPVFQIDAEGNPRASRKDETRF